MLFEEQILAAVHGAAQDAVRAAEDHWKKTPELRNAAMLTKKAVDADLTGVSAELAFAAHAERIPVHTRDRYGVARSRPVMSHVNRRRRADDETLVRETENALEEAFCDSFSARSVLIP